MDRVADVLLSITSEQIIEGAKIVFALLSLVLVLLYLDKIKPIVEKMCMLFLGPGNIIRF